MLRKLGAVGLFVVIAACLLIVVYARPDKIAPRSTSGHVNQIDSVVAEASGASTSTEVEMVTVRPWGFEPTEIVRPPGPFFLAIDNHSGLNEVDVSLELETGPRVQAVGLSRNRAKWRQKMSLAPGTYLLRVANNPQWTCRITVQP